MDMEILLDCSRIWLQWQCGSWFNGKLLKTAKTPSKLPYIIWIALRNWWPANKGRLCFVLEAVQRNWGSCLPMPGYLQGVERYCTGRIHWFLDEVMTGIPLARWEPRAIWGEPDMTRTLGKIIGGGMPVDYVGRRVMDFVWQLASISGVHSLGKSNCDGGRIRMLTLLNDHTRGLYSFNEIADCTLPWDLLQLFQDRVRLYDQSTGEMYFCFFTSEKCTGILILRKCLWYRFIWKYFQAMLWRGV